MTDTQLKIRKGWELDELHVPCRAGHIWVEVVHRGQFAVHRMVSSESTVTNTVYDDGFAISLYENGYRISSGGRVFATSFDAMDIAERMEEAAKDWIRFFKEGIRFNRSAVVAMNAEVDIAESQGKILPIRVLPWY